MDSIEENERAEFQPVSTTYNTESSIHLRADLIQLAKQFVMKSGERMSINELKVLIKDHTDLFLKLMLAFDEDKDIHLSSTNAGTNVHEMAYQLRLDPHATVYLEAVIGEPPRRPYKAWWHGDSRKFKFLVKDYQTHVFWYEVRPLFHRC